MLDTAQIDALFQIDGTAERFVEGGIVGRDVPHAHARVIMAIGAGLAGRRRPCSSKRFPRPDRATILQQTPMRQRDRWRIPPSKLVALLGSGRRVVEGKSARPARPAPIAI